MGTSLAGTLGAEPGRARRSAGALAAFVLAAAVLSALFAGLGIWQIVRRSAKLDLIARVETRVHAAPVPPPARSAWPSVTASTEEYRHVGFAGVFLHDRETFVQAVTEFGPGFWLMTPLREGDGQLVLVNRGFVPADCHAVVPGPRPDPAGCRLDRPHGAVTVTGLLRLAEPGGAFLRSNDARVDRWYSRDVQAIASARGLADAAPYFVDAGPSAPGAWPLGGLTVIRFANNHLVYAATWFALALLAAGGGAWLVRDERRRREG